MWKKIINEAAIRPGGSSYSPYGHILILAGGGGSGKSFVMDTAIDFEGKKFDIDELKKRVMKFKSGSALDQKFFAKTSRHLASLDLKNSEDATILHQFCWELGLDDKCKDMLFADVKDRTEKPNIIFDMTMRNERSLTQVCDWARMGGYDPKNIHIVWILTDFDQALANNAKRDRVEPKEVLSTAHEGVSKHFREILSTTENLTDTSEGSNIVDGDIWVFFNNSGVDNFVKHSGRAARRTKNGTEIGGEMTTINAIRIKRHGNPLPDFETIMKMKVKEFDKDGNLVSRNKVSLREKISDYVPDGENWQD